MFTCIYTHANNDMFLYTSGQKYKLTEESKKEGNILLSKTFKYNGREIDIKSVDSLLVGNNLYRPVLYENETVISKVLFLGENEGYMIKRNDETVILIKSPLKQEWIKVTDKNKLGVYNYLYSDCIKNDSGLLKSKLGYGPLNVTQAVTKKLNCERKPYRIFIKPKKIDVYLGALAEMNLYFPKVKTANQLIRIFNTDKVKITAGYSAGGRMGIVLDNVVDINFAIQYTKASASFTSQNITNSYTIYDTLYAHGNYINKSIDIEFNVRYLFLKSKLTPTLSGGVYFSKKKDNYAKYDYTYNTGNPSSTEIKDFAEVALGVKLSAGLNYKPIDRLNLFMDIGYKIGAGLYGPISYKVSESYFFTAAGFCVKLNK